jgi:Putative MetA-pathway of phenol degradation
MSIKIAKGKSIMPKLAFFALCTLLALSNPTSAGLFDRDSRTLFSWDGNRDVDMELPAMATDRPDFTEASSTVGRGVAQLESGYLFSKDDNTKSHSFGESLLRAGVYSNWFELRAAIFPVSISVDNGVSRETASGLEDLYLGCKLALTPQLGWLPEVAVVPQLTVPTGGSNFTDDRVLPGVNLLYGWDITEKLSFGASTQYNSSIDSSNQEHAQFAQSLTLNRSLNDKLTMFTEWFSLMPHNAVTARTEHYINGGFTYLVTSNIQADIRSGMGLNDASVDFFAGAGLSIRFH